MTPINTQKLERLQRVNTSLKDAIKSCAICPRRCMVDRTNNEQGFCRALLKPKVYSYLPHRGEEPPISGSMGSGTIFFSHCNMKCVYCQNYIFSQQDNGVEMAIEKLATIMLDLQSKGCHNINFVTPTHYVPQILLALEIALKAGLNIPIVYNTSGYELVQTLSLLEGIVDIYLPDMRYSDNDNSRIYSGAADYVTYNRAAIKEMYRQVGNLEINSEHIAIKGMIIRLLALPNDISGTVASLRFIKNEFGDGMYLSIMSQYYPTYLSSGFTPLSRGILQDEYKNVVDEVRLLGLNNGWTQADPGEIDRDFLGTNIKPQ